MLKTKSLDSLRFQLMASERLARRGERAKARRRELELTQEDIADRIQELHAERNPGAPQDRTRGQTVSDYERGVNDPRGERLEIWAEALGWTVADLEADAPRQKNGGDLMGSLTGALQESAGDEALETLQATLTEGLDRLSAELTEIRQLLASSGRKQKGSGS